MPKIAISYRRSDSQDITGRINDHLVPRFGRDAVFRDIDSMWPGMDFRDQIAEAIAATDVLLVIIGPSWFGRDEGKEARIENEADPVRIEVESALGRKIPVIPVLVGGMQMPTVRQLPESIRDLAYRHAVVVDGGRDFDHHMNGLIKALERIFVARDAQPRQPETPVREAKVGAAPEEVRSKSIPRAREDDVPKAASRSWSFMQTLRLILVVFVLVLFFSLGIGALANGQAGGIIFLLLGGLCGAELYRQIKNTTWAELLAPKVRCRQSSGSGLDPGPKS